MDHLLGWKYVLATMTFLSFAWVQSWTQETKGSDRTLEPAVIAKLASLIYPPVARVTNTTGDVVLNLEIRPNGSVASAVVISGHPLLKEAALENAQRSQFACRDCSEDGNSYRLVYTFELTQTDSNSPEDRVATVDPVHPGLRITQSVGHVIVRDQGLIFSDPGPDHRKVRSAKCLYLWKCGTSF
jgi:TonB family protein